MKYNINMIKYCSMFDESLTQVYEIFPKIFNDNRGSFTEVLKNDRHETLSHGGIIGIAQINRSKSIAGTIRGMHAQRFPYCQAKLVEALTDPIFDIITDARPDSMTFGNSQIFKLDPIAQNKLYVPQGFLHGFVVPKCTNQAVFQYYCDNVYSHESEFGINPVTLLPKLVSEYNVLLNEINDVKTLEDFADLFELFASSELVFSEKDKNGLDYETWMKDVCKDYNMHGNLWYKSSEKIDEAHSAQ